MIVDELLESNESLLVIYHNGYYVYAFACGDRWRIEIRKDGETIVEPHRFFNRSIGIIGAKAAIERLVREEPIALRVEYITGLGTKLY